jgi:hypothetical protein
MEFDKVISKAQDGQCADQGQTRTSACVPSELEGQRLITVDSSTAMLPQENEELSLALEDCFTELVELEVDLSNLKLNDKQNPSPVDLIEYLQSCEIEMDEGLTLKGKKKDEFLFKIFIHKEMSQKVATLLEEISVIKNLRASTRYITTEKKTKYPYYRSLFVKGVEETQIQDMEKLKGELKAAEIVRRKNCLQVYWENEAEFFNYEKRRTFKHEGKNFEFEPVYIKEAKHYKAVLISQFATLDRHKMYTWLKKQIRETECISYFHSFMNNGRRTYVYAYVFRGAKKQRMQEIMEKLKTSKLGQVTRFEPKKKKPQKKPRNEETPLKNNRIEKMITDDPVHLVEQENTPKPQKRQFETESPTDSKVPKADGGS